MLELLEGKAPAEIKNLSYKEDDGENKDKPDKGASYRGAA